MDATINMARKARRIGEFDRLGGQRDDAARIIDDRDLNIPA